MTWHADTELLAAYATGDIDDARAFSLEAHLLSCSQCRSACGSLADRARLEEAWADIVDRVDRPHAGIAERALRRIGVREHIARLLVATPSLQLSWFAAVAAALAFAVLAAYGGATGMLPFLVIAPLIPLVGVAAAYGPGIDPTYEIGLSAPMRGFHVLLVRSSAVLSTSLLLAGASSLFLPRLDWTAAAWLLPSLTLSALALSLSTVVDPLWAAGSVAMTWIGTVTAVERIADPRYATFRGPGQLTFALVTVAAVALLVARRSTFEIVRPE
jgi:hypothetical protein